MRELAHQKMSQASVPAKPKPPWAKGCGPTVAYAHTATEKKLAVARSALKVIHTWATFRNGELLVPEHAAGLTERALKLSDPEK